MFLKKFVNTFSKTLIYWVKDRGKIGEPLKIFSNCWLEIELKESYFFKQGMQNQLIFDDWRFLYVFLLRLLQAIWIQLLHRSQQIALYLLATAFWYIPHRNLTIVIVMVWSKISSGDRVGIAVSVFIAQF